MGNVVASFTANISGYQRAMAQMASATKAMQSSTSSISQKVGSAMSSIGKGVTIAGVAITAMAAKAVTGYGNFENSINKAAVVGGSSSKALKGNMTDLENEALNLGTKLPVSAQDVSDAMLEMARNGATVGELKTEFPKIAEAAAVAGEDMTGVATTVQQAMNIWGGGAKNAAKDSAVLALNANKSSASVTDMGQVFANVGSSAKNLGLSVVDVSTATGIMSNSGLQAAQGSQDLNYALTRMVKPTKAQQTEMQKLGLTYTNSNGTFKSFRTILGEVAKATNGMSNSQRAAALNTLFGSAGAKAMIPLLNAVNTKTKDGKTKWDDYSGSLSKVSSSSKAANDYLSTNAQNMTKNVGQSIDQMKDDWTSLMYSALQGESTPLQNVAKWFGNLATSIEKSHSPLATFAKTFIALSPAIGVGTIAAGLFITAIGKIVGAFSSIIGAVSSVGGAMGSLFSLIMKNPYVALAVAIAAAVAALVYFFTQTKTGQQIWASFTSFLSNAWNTIKTLAISVWNGIGTFLTTTWTNIVTMANTIWTGIGTFFSNLWTGIQTTAMGIWNGIGTFFTTLWAGIVTTATTIWTGFTTTLSGIWSGVVGIASSVWGALTAFFSTLWNGIVTFALSVWDTFGSSISTIWNGIVQIATGIWGLIKAAIMGPILLVIDLVTGDFTHLSSDLSLIWNKIVQAATAIWNGLGTVINGVADFIKAYAVTAWNSISSMLSTIWHDIVSIGTSLWNGFKSFMSSLWNGIKSLATSAWNAIVSFLKSAWNGVINTGKSVWNGFKSFMSGLWNGIKSTAMSVWNYLRSAIPNTISSIKSTGISLWNGFKSGVVSVWNGLRSAVVNAAMSVVNGIHSAWNGIASWASSMWSGVKSAIKGALNFNLLAAGESIMNSFYNGLVSSWHKVTSFVGGIASWIRQHKGPISYDAKLLIPAGNAIMGGLNNGLQKTFSDVQSNVSNMAGSIANTITDATSDIAGGNISANFSQDDLVQPISDDERVQPTFLVNNEIVGDKIYTSVKTNEARKSGINKLKLGGA